MTLHDFLWLLGSVFGIFSIVIIITRLFGLRTFAKMSSFDFASTITVGSVLASIILNNDYSLIKGGVTLLAIITFQALFSYLVRKNETIKQFFTNKPQLIMYNGKILHSKLKRCNVAEDDLLAKLREANVHDFNEVKAVIFESTGDVSVIHNNENKAIKPEILTDIDSEHLNA